jgi:hypothetical protein
MPIENAERERRTALLRAHYNAENNHALDRIMETFSADAEMLYNGQSFPNRESIRQAHRYLKPSLQQAARATRERSFGVRKLASALAWAGGLG